MILAIPLTGITKIIFGQFESLKPYAYLLQSEEENDQSEDKSILERITGIFKKSEKKD